MIQDREKRLKALAEEFRDCQDVLFAIGDKNRQSIATSRISSPESLEGCKNFERHQPGDDEFLFPGPKPE